MGLVITTDYLSGAKGFFQTWAILSESYSTSLYPQGPMTVLQRFVIFLFI